VYAATQCWHLADATEATKTDPMAHEFLECLTPQGSFNKQVLIDSYENFPKIYFSFQAQC